MAVPVGVGPVSVSEVVANAVPGGTKTAAQNAGQVRVTCAIVDVKAVSGTSLGELVENTEDAFGVRGIRGKDKILLPAMLGTRGMFVGVGKRDGAVVLKENVGVKEDGRGLEVFSARAVGTHGGVGKKVGRSVEMYEQVPSEVAKKTHEGR